MNDLNIELTEVETDGPDFIAYFTINGKPASFAWCAECLVLNLVNDCDNIDDLLDLDEDED